MRPNDLIGLLAVTVALTVSVASADTADGSRAVAIAQHGDGRGTPPCASCHGQSGRATPRPAFLVWQDCPPRTWMPNSTPWPMEPDGVP